MEDGEPVRLRNANNRAGTFCGFFNIVFQYFKLNPNITPEDAQDSTNKHKRAISKLLNIIAVSFEISFVT